MRPSPEFPLTVVEAGGGRLEEAAAALMGGSRDRGRRYLAQLKAQGLAPGAALGLSDVDGRLRAAAILTRHAGRTAMLTITAPRHRGECAQLAPLAAAACARGKALDVDIVQSLLDPSESLSLELLAAGGMKVIGTLAYLERSLGRDSPVRAPALPAGVRIDAWDPDDRATLERLLEESYIDTRDCPGLAQMRDTCDILDGHIATGTFEPGMWWILSDEAGPAGVALLSSVPAAQCIEVVYFGLSPRVRGRGLARVLLDHALASLRHRSERTVALACDERNTVAMRLYTRAGFSKRLARAALVAPVREPARRSLVHSR